MYVCKQCGIEFSNRTKYCSVDFCSIACRNKARAISSKKSTFTCKWCGKEFVDWTYRNPTMCSSQCRSEYGAHQPKPSARRPENFITKACEVCGKEYKIHKCQDARKNNTKSRFCSNMCKAKFVSNSMIGEKNANYIDGSPGQGWRGPNWGAEARQIRHRDYCTCQVCGKNGKKDHVQIDVHHIIPFRLFDGNYTLANNPSNLISLCISCHKKVECGKIKLS